MGSEYYRWVYDDETGELIAVFKVDNVPSPPLPPPPNGQSEDWISFRPQWRVGASGGLFADPGAGYLNGWYQKSPVRLVVGEQIFDRHMVEVFIELKAQNPNIPDGEGFEFILPGEITPLSPENSRGSGGDLWIEGGENSYSIAAKWTDRNDRPMRLLILLDGREWTTNVPKKIPLDPNKATASCYFGMKYLI
jgi:hypothetical protein